MVANAKRKIARIGTAIGAIALCWLLESTGLIKGGSAPGNGTAAVYTDPAVPAAQAQQSGNLQAVSSSPAAPAVKEEADVVVQSGEYYDKVHVAAYIRRFGGKLPGNYITKEKARQLGWQGGPLEPFAPGKAIGGDRFGNYERKLPAGAYRECDIDTRGKPRGVKRLIYTASGRNIYYTADHYETFEEVPAR